MSKEDRLEKRRAKVFAKLDKCKHNSWKNPKKTVDKTATLWHTTGMSNSNTTTQPLTLGTDGMECNFCEQVIPWHELKSHQCQDNRKEEQ